VLILVLVAVKAYGVLGASSVPSFSAVPETSLIVRVEPCGTSKRYSQKGSSVWVVVGALAVEEIVASTGAAYIDGQNKHRSASWECCHVTHRDMRKD
jgi:hypothetical protein